MNKFFKEKNYKKLKNNLFSSFIFRNLSTNKEFQVRLMPMPKVNSTLIIPISVSRYNSTPEKVKKFDEKIDALLNFTAKKLEKGEFSSVEVFSTAGLNSINWGAEKSKKIDEHFFNTHANILSRQTKFYDWESFKSEVIGEKKLKEFYELVESESEEGTEWYNLMIKSKKAVGTNNTIESSLQYQRTEYAAMSIMASIYSHIIYMGFISPAWAYLYNIHRNMNLPIFTQACIEEIDHDKYIKTKRESITDIVAGVAHEALTSEKVPEAEKEKIREILTSLLHTYQPKVVKNIPDINDEIYFNKF